MVFRYASVLTRYYYCSGWRWRVMRLGNSIAGRTVAWKREKQNEISTDVICGTLWYTFILPRLMEVRITERDNRYRCIWTMLFLRGYWSHLCNHQRNKNYSTLTILQIESNNIRIYDVDLWITLVNYWGRTHLN